MLSTCDVAVFSAYFWRLGTGIAETTNREVTEHTLPKPEPLAATRVEKHLGQGSSADRCH